MSREECEAAHPRPDSSKNFILLAIFMVSRPRGVHGAATTKHHGEAAHFKGKASMKWKSLGDEERRRGVHGFSGIVERLANITAHMKREVLEFKLVNGVLIHGRGSRGSGKLEGIHGLPIGDKTKQPRLK
ncbi:hypothetical protein LR48_Vigan10g241000 [Vigna angularis]|uniref:Uncharacterized protein n=1 Tax=Phaseolus angularis TaxID=3914 RepID=A0A0L9VNJ2_PHAAN|nr:hypothetical protein LR48_Vigan10g241000 [Vigna angularis]